MKKIVLFIALLAFTLTTSATRYRMIAQTDKSECQFEITNLKVTTNGDAQPKYEFFSSLEKLATGDNILTQHNAIGFIGATGRDYNVAKIFETHANRAQGVEDISFTTNYEDDVLCKLTKVGYKYFIVIYTGEDAIEYRKKLAEHKKAKMNK